MIPKIVWLVYWQTQYNEPKEFGIWGEVHYTAKEAAEAAVIAARTHTGLLKAFSVHSYMLTPQSIANIKGLIGSESEL